ncbi:MAG: type II toxin-antitoxin system HicA family toxin [Bacteroidales bacterium]
MTVQHLRNIPLKTIREYLIWKGLRKYRTSGGHEIWGGSNLGRPITIQTHIDPVPEFIVKQILRALNADRDDFLTFLNS